MNDQNTSLPDFTRPYVWLATWFGFGLIKPAPGTWGSLAALPFGGVIFKTFGVEGLLVAIVLITYVGLWASKRFDAATGGHDNKAIVIDEVVGQWIALIPAGIFFALNAYSVAAAFILFRFFDILKPYPIGLIDKNLKGEWGVMMDDVAAGIVAALIMIGAYYAGIV